MKRKSLFAVLFISIICTACSSKPTEIQSTTVTDGENSEAQDDLNNNNDIEAEKYSVYRVKEKDFEPELLEELFLSERTVEQKRESPSFDFDDFTDTVYECSDGSSLVINGANIYFRTKESNDYPLQFFYDDKMRTLVFEDDLVNLFPKKDLYFMNYHDAVNYVEVLLNDLGVITGESWEVYPLEADKLEDAIKNYYTDEEYEQDIVDGYKPVKREYEQEDEVYLFRIPLTVDGNIITYLGYESNELQYTLYGSSVEVILGAKGLLYFSVTNDYEITNIEETDNIISEDEAIGIIEEEYSHLLGMNISKIESKGFYYVPIVTKTAKRDGYSLIPAYIVIVTQSANDEKGEWKSEYVEIVDAISGNIM